MRAPLLVVVAALLVGCGSTGPAVTAPGPPAAGPEQDALDGLPSTLPEPRDDLGRTLVNGDIAVTVKSTRTVDAIELNQNGSRTGSGSERYTTTAAGDGAEYVVLTARVANNGRSGFTMTCNAPIRTALVDDQQHSFDPIGDLSRLRGNPDCDNELRPGSVHDVSWPYRVPSGAKIVGWTFQDLTDPNARHDPTTVRLSGP